MEEDSSNQERVGSPCLSMKSDRSMDRPIMFGKDASGNQERVGSPCLSMKSDWSMDRPIFLGKDASGNQERVGSPCLSMKSDWSMDRPIFFGKDASVKQERVWSPCLSMKSDCSMDRPIMFGKDASELTACLLTEDHFRCSVCTEVFKEPVSIPCGHSYCRRCIETYWNQPDQTGDYDCPQCRKRFRTRPDLLTNSALEKVIEKLHQAGFKVPDLPKHCYAGPGDVACDFCTEKQLKAVKSCLTCTASYCERHVKHHYTVAALQRHTLVEVTGNLEQKLCQLHHRALEVFCKTDQVSVCVLCALQDHRNHDVIKNERDTVEENTKTQEEQIASRLEARLQREITILQHNTEELATDNTEQNVKNATIELNNPAKHFCRSLTEDWTADSVVVAALGRPFDLGMLYDCRSDSFDSDVSLWDKSTIAFMRHSLPRPLTEVKCIEGDSLQDRFRALDVTTPLRASVLSGLVEVGGAAGYLNHPVQSTLQDRVTLQYRTTTRLDMLSHRVLQEERVRTQRKATHVVMAVLYGAQAFFTFDYKHISGQHSGAGEADIHSVVKKTIPTFSADQIFSSLSDDEKPNSLLYQCTLYCDLDHINGSMTYDRALKVYETLPKLLGQQGEEAVPLYAWLYPLKNLDNSVEIKFFTKAEGVLDHLRQATMRCQEMMTDFTNGCVMKWFPDLKYKLSRLSELLQKYQLQFKRELAMAVKTMRESEGVDENRLRDILQNHDQSPFCLQSIQLWLNNKAAEVKSLNVCKTRNIPIMKSQEELDAVLRSSKDRLLCFTLTSLEDEDPFLSTMEQHKHSVPMNTVNQSDLTGQQHKHSVPMNTVNQSDLTGQQETQRPFKPPDLTQKIQSALRLFTKSYEDSGDGENIKFIAAVIPDISVPGSSIRLYQQGSLITTNFQLGLKPDPGQVAEIKQSCVLLTFPQSTIRRPERYRVEYRVMTTGVSKVSKRPWNVVDTLAPAETCLVPGLKPFTLYQIRYSVIEHSGMSDFSKVIEVKTLRSPPEQLYVSRLLNKTKETVKVTWFQPECEDGASVLHYNVDYKETGLEGWSTMVTEGPECYCDVTLNLSTCYRVRVSAVYGEGDTSATSRETDVPVNVWYLDLSENKASLLLEVLKLQPEKKPVELKGWSDEESEVRSFLMCLSYISQLRLCVGYGEEKAWTVLSKLSVAAAEFDTETGENILKTLSSMCRYTDDDDGGGVPFRESDFLLDLYSHVKDYETQTGRSVLPALQTVYQSAPAVWSILLSERKASLLLEVLKLQPEKKPVELKGWSDEESEVRSFLQCLPYISQLSFHPRRSDPSKLIKFLVDLLSQAAEWEEQTGEKTLKLVSSVCTYRTFPYRHGDTSKQSDFLLDLFSHVKDYETQTGRSVLPALQPVYQSASPAIWSIDLSERKASLLLEVLKLQPEKKPVELKGWSDEESEVRSFLQCLPYISQLSCGDDRFFQTVCESIPVRSREEDQLLASLLQALGSTLSLGGVLPRKTCRSVGRVLGLCASRVDLTLTPSKISLQGAALLLRHESKLHKLRLNVGVAVKLSRLVRRTGRGATPLTVPELSLVLKSSQPPEIVLSRALSSVASLLRFWRVQCLDLTDLWIQGHSLITLLCHQGPLSLRLNSDTLQQLTVVVYKAQDKDLTQWFLEKVGGDLTSCRLDWEVLLSLLQHSTHNITVDLRKNQLLEKNSSDLLPFLGRVTLKRSSSSFVKSSIRQIYDSRDSDCVSSLLRSSDHWINLNSRELDRVDCTALCFTLQHSHQVKVNLLWTSIPPGEIESILPFLDRVSQLSVDRRLLLSFLQCCAASQIQQGAPSSPPTAVWLLRSLQHRLDLSCSSSVDLSAQDPGEALCLTTDHCRAINSVLKQNQHSIQLVQNQVQLILRDCEVEDRALRELLPSLHIVKLSPSKALLLQLLDLVCEGIEEGLLRHAESLCRALDGELDLSETRLDQKACGSLAMVLEHSEGLSELDLSHCQLTDHQLQPLITHLHKVQVLDLSHNDITDALTDRILQLVSTNTSIHTVRLFNNRIQDRRPFLTDKRFDIWCNNIRS
ncbi:uncharacterized protein LOC110513232 isoform X2 [Oncorhynchus mykiss]|uniref:uncharacterized protein LOC110513232 isoform X2 n=1 Tax=Oncorhynchus mykiss TaxID=8022 RepID=UPI001877BCE1|nr:uncharacterized protein LOC110513232 isoform X2 [Oncorhynchus mykiss]